VLAWIEAETDETKRRIAVRLRVRWRPWPGARPHTARLVAVAAEGIARFWSRTVRRDGREWQVDVTAEPRDDGLPVHLHHTRLKRYLRSHNSGILAAHVYYNAGFFDDPRAADANFRLTVAHELGHSVLEAAGGRALSWTHKGSSTWLQRPRSDAPFYPQEGPIDLMRYWRADAEHPVPRDRYARTLAAEEDVLRLLRLALPADAPGNGRAVMLRT
jgi:hypothetical protein